MSFTVSTAERPKFTEPLTAYLFDANGALVERADVKNGKVELSVPGGTLGRHRLFVAPTQEIGRPLTAEAMTRLGAYEPVLHAHEGRVFDIRIPGIVIDHWPFCFCWVRGKVVRASDNRAVCDARVHICEVDRIPWLIARLPDLEILKVRDDLLDLLRRPPRPWPEPWPPDPEPFRDPRPGPDPSPIAGALFRFDRVALNPQPLPPRTRVALNPQPLPPGARVGFDPQPDPPGLRASAAESIAIAPEVHARLRATSAVVVRNVLVEQWKLLLPWLCWWRWPWLYSCDELAVVTTDSQGRFETTIVYPCGGDRPDLYFWVEFDFGSGWETVYHPWIACHTWWNYECGTPVTIRVTDPRVPGCEHEPDLPGCQVVVLSIGNGVAVREVQTGGTTEGQTTAGEPFGHTLEPRVDFSRTELITGKNVPYYRWSYRRLTAPDGGAGPVDPTSVPLNSWTPMTRDVYRHYKLGTSYPSELMGPLPSGPAPAPNLFKIRPLDPPAGNEWVVLNEHIDLATAYFDSHLLAGATAASPTVADLAAGRYELKLELFDAAGALVNWTAKGIDLRITNQDAPFGTGTITTSPAPDYNRILVGGQTMGFRMVVRVDNNRCYAEIFPVGGDVTPDPDCGFHNYSSLSDDARLSFRARHPNHFATYGFSVTRGPGGTIGAAGTSGGVAGDAGIDGFLETSDFVYAKDVAISALLGTCSNAAFAERLDVYATATNGYGTLTGYNAGDNAAFALAVPCPECDCDDNDDDDEEDGNGPD